MLAPKNLFVALALAMSASAESPTSFASPVDPLVDTTSEISDGTVLEEIGPNEIAGPSLAKALARRAVISAMVHVGSIARISRCDVCSIARVGYRSKSKMEES